MYPALVNCTTIDWFSEWPPDALLEVAERYLDQIELGPEDGPVYEQFNLGTRGFSISVCLPSFSPPPSPSSSSYFSSSSSSSSSSFSSFVVRRLLFSVGR